MYVYQADGTRTWRDGRPQHYNADDARMSVVQRHNGYYDRFYKEQPQQPHWTNHARLNEVQKTDEMAERYYRARAAAERYAGVDLLDRNIAQHYAASDPGFPGPISVIVPTLEMSGRLIIGFSRNPKAYNFPRYAQYVQSSEITGLYMKMQNQEAARIVTTQEFNWADGAQRPQHDDGLEKFKLLQYICIRDDFGYNLGWITAKRAPWDIHAGQQRIKLNQAMTDRTVKGLSVATTTSNFQTSSDTDMVTNHTDTAANVAGGFLDLGTSSAPYVKKFMDKTAVLINKDTLGAVSFDGDAVLNYVFNPNVARLLSEGSEIHEYIKGSYWAKEELNYTMGPRPRFGIPSQLYGYGTLVEDAVKVTSRVGDTLAKSYVMPDQQIVALSRVGGLEGIAGGPSFSSLTWFWWNDELTLEMFSDSINRRDRVGIVQCGVAVLTSPLSSYLLTSATSVAS